MAGPVGRLTYRTAVSLEASRTGGRLDAGQAAGPRWRKSMQPHSHSLPIVETGPNFPLAGCENTLVAVQCKKPTNPNPAL